MTNLKQYTLTLITLLSVAFFSCDDNDDKPKGEFEHGVFVVNEGNFTAGNGTISFIDRTSGTVSPNLFGTVNNGLATGDVVQSLTIDDDFAYIVANNSNKMEVVNVNTFKSEYTLSGLALPRYFTTLDGIGYVTEWVSFEDVGRVSIIDLTSHAVTSSITTDFGAENIIGLDGKLYVSNNFSNTVSVIDPVSKEVIKTIEVGGAPGGFAVDSGNKLWVICGGNYKGNDGSLIQIDPSKSGNPDVNSVLKTIQFDVNVDYKLAINKEKNKIYYYKNNSVYAVNISDTAAPTAALLTEAASSGFYSIGIDPDTNVLYLGDAKAFTGNGEVYRYQLTGAAVDHVTVGIGPNGFAFK